MSFEIEKDWTTGAGLRAVCLIVLFGGRKNHRCGYVGVPRDHPLYGVGYSQQAECLTSDDAASATVGKKSPLLALTAGVGSDGEGLVRRSPDVVFDCHGGLTFSGGGDYPVTSDLWWFGFDCCHAGDGEIEASHTSYLSYERDDARTLDYVRAECEALAAQLAGVTNNRRQP